MFKILTICFIWLYDICPQRHFPLNNISWRNIFIKKNSVLLEKDLNFEKQYLLESISIKKILISIHFLIFARISF